MAGINGNGSDDEVTPTETPQATLFVHRPYVLALTSVIAPLYEVCNTLQEVLHELRIAREPAAKSLIKSISEAGKAIEGVGATLAMEFGK